MKKIFSSLALVLMFSLFGTTVYGQESVMLKYNYKPGKAFRTTTTTNQEVVQSMMGQEMKVLVDVSTVSELKITKVDTKGNGTALVSIINLSVNTSAMGKNSVAKKEDFKKDNICAVMSETGKSISTSLVDSTEASDTLNSSLQNIKMQALPARMVKIGEKWQYRQIDTTNIKAPNPVTFMTTTTDAEYTLEGKEIKDGKELYRISYTGKLEIVGKGNQMGMEVFMEGTGALKGSFYFDPKISMVVYTDGLCEMNTTISVSGQQNMSIPMTQTIKSTSKTEAL